MLKEMNCAVQDYMGVEEGPQIHALTTMGYHETELGISPSRLEVEELV